MTARDCYDSATYAPCARRPRCRDAPDVNSPETAAHEAAVAEETLVVPARDGYPLGATLFRVAQPRAVGDVAVFNAGGGLAFERYRHFLRFVAGEGVPVLAYDYRGVGRSRVGSLRGFEAGLDDWAELDHAAAIDFLGSRFPGARRASISHSIGCLVACTAPNAASLDQMVYIGPHTGYWRDYRMPWRVPMAITWHVLMPLIARVVGYFPGRALRLGDDFPLRFALQWAGRRRSEFDVDEPRDGTRARERLLLDCARALDVPALAISMFDDAFVSESAVRRFLFAIPEAPVVRAEIEADATGGEAVGHFGFFSRRRASLWPIVTRFLQTHPVP
jgi:predicted alpha/beta hydrolase